MRTLKGTYTKNGVLYKYNAMVPDMTVFVHSKHIFFKITITNNIDVQQVNKRIQLIAITSNTALNEFRDTDSQGTATYDAARMLQITKGDVKNELDINQNIDAQLENGKRFTCGFYDGGTQIVSFFLELLTGANDTTDKWWMGRRRLRWFVNYPFTFDFENINGNWSIGDLGETPETEAFPYVTTSMTKARVRLNAKRLFGSEMSSSAGKTITAKIDMATNEGSFASAVSRLDLIVDRQSFDLDKKCYLRWIGKHGEIFYWLFRKHDLTQQTSKEIFKRAYIDDGYNRYGVIDTEAPADFKKADILTVFTDMLNNDEYEVVKSIITSPYVDMLVSYVISTTPRNNGTNENDIETDVEEETRAVGDYLEEATRWQRVTVNDGRFVTIMKHDKNFTDKQMIISLSLPEEGGLSI